MTMQGIEGKLSIKGNAGDVMGKNANRRGERKPERIVGKRTPNVSGAVSPARGGTDDRKAAKTRYTKRLVSSFRGKKLSQPRNMQKIRKGP